MIMSIYLEGVTYISKCWLQ